MRILLRLLALLPLLALVTPSVSHAQTDLARRVEGLIAGLDYEPARQILESADADDPAIAVERARLAIYELDCDGAAAILARPEVQKTESGEQLADIARGCQRVTAALASDRDEKRGIELRWQDEHDRALAPLVFDTVAAARETLSRELGVDWPLPTRIVIVRDLLSLSAMTGLPYKSAQTTGTVAVAKWGRVTLLSPRASPHGYQWRDTIAHELTHLAVTRASGDRAPLWLQEGVAKREEIRWRTTGPFDDRPTPEAIVTRGTELNLGIPLDKLGPSIAMLPSADAAMVAFAEVTSFVRYYARTQGDDALPKLLSALKDGAEPDQALVSASGADLQAWDSRWRAYVASRPAESLPALFGLGGEKTDASRLRDLRDRSRLAELLLARDHAPEALKELDRIELAGGPTSPEGWERAMGDPSVVWLRARALEASGRQAEAEPLVADPLRLLSPYAPWWATRGRYARLRADEPMAGDSFWQAVAADPFDPEGACETIDAAALPADPAKAPLCSAARAWTGTAPFGSD
ncbi:MAG TPA: hypothetical protein VF765_33090 [Polyangiaceae bacterium]